MRVKITDWQLLHMDEHVISHIAECSLCHIHHNLGLREGGKRTADIENSDTSNGMGEVGEIRGSLFRQWNNIVIDQCLHE